MIRICSVCGKPFEGRPNSFKCSEACRLEAKKQYMAKYRQLHKGKVAEAKSKWYHKKKGTPYIPKVKPDESLKFEDMNASNSKDHYLKQKSRVICQDSTWGRTYFTQSRLDQLVMLSTELSQLNILRITYGYLSAIRDFDKERYLSLLKQVVDAKEGKL